MKAFVAVLAVCSLASMAEALLPIVASPTVGLAIPLVGGASATLGPVLATATAVAGGTILLKSAAALGVLAASNGARGKRSAKDESQSEATFAFLSQSEPQACYHRLICDLASGGLPASDNDVILSVFNEEVPATSTKFEYAIAAQVGKALKNVQACEVRYSCPLTGSQINKLFD